VVWAIIGARIMHVLADGQLESYVNLCLDPIKVPAVDARVAICYADAQCGYDYLCDEATRRCHPPRDCLATLKVWRGGLAFYGGFILATVLGLRYARKHGLPMGKVADLSAPWVAFGLFLTRIGCFLNGCCHGKIVGPEAWWGVRFPAGSLVHDAQEKAGLLRPGEPTLPVHPTQLYLAALNLLTFLVLYFVVRKRKRFEGEVFAWLLVLKGVFRSIVEIWRDDERGVFFGGHVSTSQLLSVPLVIIGVWLIARGRARSAPSRAVETPPP
jgi:phosphatidylglycerol---prolipoprotein diacylglyceryl transferase